MKSCSLIFASLVPCLLVSILIFYPIISNEHRILKIGEHFLLVNKSDPYYDWHRTTAKYLKLPLDHHYGSHVIVLLAALYTSKAGPILELGMGSSSSPLLHRIALEQKRLLVSADSDRRWINHFSSYAVNNSLHRLKYIEVTTELGVEWAISSLADSERWNIVFLDHRPGPRRKFDLILYADRSDIVIIHDTEQSTLYQYDQALSMYPYQYRFTRLRTYTDVLSMKNGSVIGTIRSLLEATPDGYFAK